MDGLAKDLFGSNVSFDAEQNPLRRAKPVTLPAAVPPPPAKGNPNVARSWTPSPRSKPAAAQPKPEGWAD